MSWSFSASGRPAAVAEKMRADLGRQPCAEPEESIKSGIVDVLGAALSAYPERSAVTVSASGSQGTDADGRHVNSLTVRLEPIWGFIE